MRVHTSVFSRRIYLNTRQREISIRPCTAWLDVCPWYYWLLWIMKRAKDYRAAFLQEVARQTMSFSSSPSSRIDRLVLRGMNLWWRAEQPSQHLTAGRALPDCCRDDRLTLGRVGVADPRGAGGSVPRRRTCWGRLTLIKKKRGGKATQETCSILPEKLRKNISCCTLSKRQNNCHLNCTMHFLHSHCQDRMRREKKKTDGALRFANNSTKAIKNPTVYL